jgi:pimeloyl-ACP methyl ester carboxylesterase
LAYLTRENNKKIYFEDNGSGSSAIILVHAWGMNLRAWDGTVPHLVDAGYRVVTLDHRGCGLSDKDFDDMSINAIASDVVALVAELGLEKVIINGWSIGGAVAIEAATMLKGTCCSLALTCPAAPVYLQKDDFPHGGTEELLSGTLQGLKADRPNFLKDLSRGIYAAEVSENIIDWTWSIFMAASPMTAITLAELGPLDQRQKLSALNMPIICFVGKNDALADPAVGHSIVDFNQDTRVVEFENSGHVPLIEESEKYHQELVAFVGAQL